MKLKLTAAEKRSILDGNVRPLIRKELPEVSRGTRFDLTHSHVRPWMDEDTGHVFRPDEEPTAWIVVTSVTKRKGKDDWVVRFDFFDSREHPLYPARGPGYTGSTKYASDDHEAVIDNKTKLRLATDARQVAADRRERDSELAERARKRQERAFRDRLRETLRGLDPMAQAILLADLERRLLDAGAEIEEAA